MQEENAMRELTMMLVTDYRLMTLFTLLAAAALIDVRSYRIPNWLNALGAAAALAFSIGLPMSMPHGFLWALQGFGLGLLLMLPLYALRTMGAGDAKLIAVVGLYLGAGGVVNAILASLLVGGVLALGYSLARGAMGRLATNLRDVLWSTASALATRGRPNLKLNAATSIGRLPFAVSIALGTSGYVIGRHFGLI